MSWSSDIRLSPFPVRGLAAVLLSLVVAMTPGAGLIHLDAGAGPAGHCVDGVSTPSESTAALHAADCDHGAEASHHDAATCVVCRSVSHAKISLPAACGRTPWRAGPPAASVALALIVADDGHYSDAAPRGPPVLS